MVRVLFLGPLRDAAGCAQADYPAPLDWSGLLDTVDPAVADELRGDRVSVAVRGRVLSDRTKLTAGEGDEIALLPPVSGG